MINKQILNYKITAEIGKGGMATVYKAKHNKLGHYVAIKILDPALAANKNIKQRFQQEAGIMASLHHENITRIIDYEESGNQLAIVMEYLEGQTLNDLIKQKGAVDPETTIRLFEKILDAFHYAHSKNIVHRDIKPSNIFITNSGNVKIMDFGIAKIIEESANVLTQTGTQMGTPVYMSPEQVNDSKHIDHLSDIYSLGVVLWFMLAGKSPYDENTNSRFAIFKKIDAEPLPELGMPFFDKIIQKATQKDKNKRFQSCAEFKNSLIKSPQKFEGLNETHNNEKTLIKEEYVNNKKNNEKFPKEIDIAWAKIKNNNNIEDFIQFRKTFPNSKFDKKAKSSILYYSFTRKYPNVNLKKTLMIISTTIFFSLVLVSLRHGGDISFLTEFSFGLISDTNTHPNNFTFFIVVLIYICYYFSYIYILFSLNKLNYYLINSLILLLIVFLFLLLSYLFQYYNGTYWTMYFIWNTPTTWSFYEIFRSLLVIIYTISIPLIIIYTYKQKFFKIPNIYKNITNNY